jgi:trans-2,3-dihydro-3-hydroxyanthranilate isomerase
MPRYSFYQVDVFTDQVFGGNPLAFFPDAAGLDDAQMQRIAREMNLSETTFVFRPPRPARTSSTDFTPGNDAALRGPSGRRHPLDAGAPGPRRATNRSRRCA